MGRLNKGFKIVLTLGLAGLFVGCSQTNEMLDNSRELTDRSRRTERLLVDGDESSRIKGSKETRDERMEEMLAEDLLEPKYVTAKWYFAAMPYQHIYTKDMNRRDDYFRIAVGEFFFYWVPKIEAMHAEKMQSLGMEPEDGLNIDLAILAAAADEMESKQVRDAQASHKDPVTFIDVLHRGLVKSYGGEITADSHDYLLKLSNKRSKAVEFLMTRVNALVVSGMYFGGVNILEELKKAQMSGEPIKPQDILAKISKNKDDITQAVVEFEKMYEEVDFLRSELGFAQIVWCKEISALMGLLSKLDFNQLGKLANDPRAPLFLEMKKALGVYKSTAMKKN